MFAEILGWLSGQPILAALFSILMNIAVAITGVLPSAFITAGTVALFGFKTGLVLLIIGEAAGAVVSFILYRKGLSKLLSRVPQSNNKKRSYLLNLKDAKGSNAFFIVIFLRVLPFVPSGAVTLTAAISQMGLLSFSIASTLGKVPALIIEAYTISHALTMKIEIQIIIIFLAAGMFLLHFIWKRRSK
ncbi:TVP38/TMEM64 family protein [Cytobacillus sp. NCCP-133]|uniref:TVP38/TMEM64 family protein n=1 Tax=Cytobacillus sp. NCCP-133 TaxID=766848 RepID=UPI00222EF95A|nr:VTT domain-containing protein [Cytobacillus sp. NCCP-133]GLB60854.1 TVP38/TMEM64 family protein [Cytobacillus sp. NCCP-133]